MFSIKVKFNNWEKILVVIEIKIGTIDTLLTKM